MPKDPYALLRALMRAEATRGERAATQKTTPTSSRDRRTPGKKNDR
ncbi:hypothetical protein ACIRLA_35605 [Streptomyces sp. NPDC102364]